MDARSDPGPTEGRRRTDWADAALLSILVVVAGAVLVYTVVGPLGDVGTRRQQVGLAFMPRAALSILLLGCLLALTEVVRGNIREREFRYGSALVPLLAALAFLVGLVNVGFVVSTFVLLYGFMWLTGVGAWRRLALSLTLTAVAALLFLVVVGMYVPPGWLF